MGSAHYEDLMGNPFCHQIAVSVPINVKQKMYARSPVTFDSPLLYDEFVW